MDIAARLDLHGMTAAQAETRLRRFIDSAALANHRCVLIITGKGRDGQGVLRKLVPEWLKTPPLSARILAMARATRADGGDGAMYVMLRRNRAAGQTGVGHMSDKHGISGRNATGRDGPE
jgi:DNA-nicking Smr family endonuclease